MSLSTITNDGRTLVLDTETLGSLANSLSGRVLTPESAGYDEARSIWNGMIDRKPAMIVRCTTEDDIVAAVRFARDHGQVVAIRGGGHNIAGNALCDSGMVIDLSLMRSVVVDPAARTARVEPGATLGDMDTATQAHGLATPLGINSTTGVAGLTLGGGFGWLSRKYGLTIDNLLSAEMVTASGQRVHVSETENSDLFWAIRGGGGNFGVVTSFEFQLHPVGPEVLAGLVVHPLDAAKDVLRFYRDFVDTTPEELACWFVLRKAPPLPFLAPEWHGREILVLAACWSGEIAEGERVLKPLREFGSPIADVIAPAPYAGWQTVLDPLLTPGERNYWKTHDFTHISDGLIDALLDHAGRIPDPQTEIAFAQLGGAIGRVATDATAYTARDANYLVNVHGRWSDPALDDACIAWARSLFHAVAPFATGGAYVNFLTADEAERVAATYGSNYARLARIKKQYDPGNLFRVNQNIRPA
jgi:FAD/FMN-containing dehydrogenase